MSSDSHLHNRMDNPQILLIGESSSLEYLTWALAEAKWQVTVVPLNGKRAEMQDKWWHLLVETKTFAYLPHLTIGDMLQLATALEDTVTIKFDVVVVTYKCYEELQSNVMVLEGMIDKRTVFLVDSNEDIWIAAKFRDLFPNNVVLSVYSDADCRSISHNSNCFRLMNDITTIMVGFTSEITEGSSIAAVDGNGPAGETLIRLRNVFNEERLQGNLVVLPAVYHRRLSKIIWKNIVRVICFESLSIIFEEPDILSLAKQINVAPLMKGVFQEILTICNYLKIKGLPSPYTESSKKLLQSSILLESNQRMKRTIACTNNREIYPQYLDATKLFYDFSRGIEINITSLLLKLLKVSDEFSIETPFLESTYSFMNRLITIRDGIDNNGNLCPSKLFQAKRILNDSKTIREINGIPPNKNMMNFPPFNPPPLPQPPTQSFFNSNPLVFMSEIHSHNNISNNKKSSSNNNINSNTHDLKKNGIPNALSSGLGDGPLNNTKSPYDKYYDAEAQLNHKQQMETTMSDTPCANYPYSQNNTSSQSHHDLPMHGIHNLPPKHQAGINSNAYYMHQNNQYYQSANPNCYPHQQYQKPMYQPYNSSLSSFATLANTSQGTNYPNGNVSNEFVNRHGSFNIPKKRQTFFHASIPITRKTSSQKLRQSHASLLDMVQFDNLMDKTTSSRYGVELDTSSTVLNSANNSRGSKASSSRTSSKLQSPQIQPAANGHANFNNNIDDGHIRNADPYNAKSRK